MPRNERPSCTAATPVLPLPANGSRTRPAGGQINLTSQRQTARGLTQQWELPAGAAFPLILNRVPDATVPTPGRDTVFSHVIMVDGVDRSAVSTRLEPHSVSQYASPVNPLVREVVNQLKFVEPVVELVVVLVVNLHAFRDGSVCPFPNKNVFHAETPLAGIPD